MRRQKMCARTEARRHRGRRLSPAANVPKSRLAPLHRQYPKSSPTMLSNPHFWESGRSILNSKLGHRPSRSTTSAGLPAMQNGHADARSSRASESPFKLDRRVDNAFYDRICALVEQTRLLREIAAENRTWGRRKKLVEPSRPQDIQFGWGTWIRTRTNGVRVRGSTVNLFPSRRVWYRAMRTAHVPRALPCSRHPKIVKPAAEINAGFLNLCPMHVVLPKPFRTLGDMHWLCRRAPKAQLSPLLYWECSK